MAGVCEGECRGRSVGNEPLTLRDATVVGCHSYRKPLGGSSDCGRAYNVKVIKGKISFIVSFLSFVSLLL